MPIKITYTDELTAIEDELLEKFSADAKDAGVDVEEWDESGLPKPRHVKRPK